MSDQVSLLHKIKAYYQSHQKRVDIGVFLGGFFFDILTLGRPDDLFNFAQQLFYIVILLYLLKLEIEHEIFLKPIPTYTNRWWPYRRFITHFLYGSLLSVYTILFFKSSSFVVSSLFILIIAVIMVLNELPFVQNIGAKVRVVLWSLCLGSFLAMHTPSLFGFIGWIPFSLSMAIGALAVWLFFYKLSQSIKETKKLKDTLLIPGLATFIILFFAYVLKLVPPVPLTLEYAGIYHRVDKVAGEYELTYDRPSWKFWQNGAQDFLAVPGDRIFAYIEVFAPTGFKDRILVRWYFYEKKSGWTQYDSIPLTITGGRESGFRGYATKSNYTPGEWQIRVETSDGREIGRLSFEVEAADPTNQRQFLIDKR